MSDLTTLIEACGIVTTTDPANASAERLERLTVCSECRDTGERPVGLTATVPCECGGRS